MGITSPRRKTLRRRRRRLRPNLRRKKERLHLTPQRSTSTPMGEAELTPRSCLRTSKVRVEWYIAVRPTQRHVTGPLANVSSSRASDHSVPIDADMFSSDPLQVEDLNAEAPSGADATVLSENQQGKGRVVYCSTTNSETCYRSARECLFLQGIRSQRANRCRYVLL